jgi:hypothetical protein
VHFTPTSPLAEDGNLPSNLQPAQPNGVLPFGLCSAFQEELRIEALTNTYRDGSSDRAALALNPRRFFKFTRRLTAPQYTALRSFYNAHLIDPFYFYNLRETVPPFTWDASGNNTVGRYIVVFDGSWSDSTLMGRSEVSLGLREVA